MKKLLLSMTLMFSMVAFAQIKPAAKGVLYGGKTTAEGAIDVKSLEQKMASSEKYTGRVKGKVIGVCEKKGCWMKLEQANGDGIMIRFKDYGFFMPQDILGKEVVLDGVAENTTTSVEMLQHYAEDAGKSKEEIAKIKDPKKEVEFTASAVLVLN
jgi:hypothetical protein